MTDAEFLAAGAPAKPLSDEAFLSAKPPAKPPGVLAEVKNVAKDVAGYAAGTFAQIEDMLLMAPRALSIPGSWASAIKAQVETGAPDIAGGAGLAYQEQFIPETFKAPFAKIAKAMGSTAENYYNNNGIGQFMQWLGGKTEEAKAAAKEKLGVPPAYTEMVINQVMDLFALKGTKSAVKDVVAKRGAAEEARQAELYAKRQAPVEMPPGPEIAKPAPVDPAELAVTPKQLKAMFAKAKAPEDGVQIVKDFFEKAKQPRVTEAAPTAEAPAEAAPAEAAPPVPAVEPWMTSPEVEAALVKEPFYRTAAEKGMLEDWHQKWKQAGEVDPRIYGVLAVGAAGAVALIRYLREQQSASAAEEQKQKNLEWETEHPKPFGTKPGGAPEQPDDWTMLAGGGALAAAGVIKPRGGMWKSEAVTGLAKALTKDLPFRDLPEAQRGPVQKFMEGHATRMVTQYLNKHAGTATDPIKDLQLPNGDKWGDLTDKAFMGRTVTDLKRSGYNAEEIPGLDKAKSDETIWGTAESGSLSSSPGTGINRIKSYLSHAGDYARANIPPEKLAQYDLPRLIRETVANDNKIAAEALRDFTKPNPVRIGDMQAMPEYKGYAPVEQGPRKFSFNKDGSIRKMEEIQLPKGEVQYSWREIKLQDELTPEQAKRVRPATLDEMRQDAASDNSMDMPDNITGDEGAFVALDAKGKPIIDNFSKRIAIEATSQEAHLAGQLAQEGNALGHCVGSYVDAVASGESRILSLRDQLGRSYATVELTKGGRGSPNAARSDIFRNAEPESIAQIKGPGNGAPADYVRPYVQDLVRNPPEGKAWGDVGDLENTGLIDLSRRTGKGLTDQFAKDKLAQGQRYATEDELTDGLVSIAKAMYNGQRGSADPIGPDGVPRGPVDVGLGIDAVKWGKDNPKLAARLAVIGGGAALGASLSDNNPVWGGVLGAAAGALVSTLGGRKILGATTDLADKGLGMVSTRIKNISEPLHHRLIQFERVQRTRTNEAVEKVNGFLKQLASVKGEPGAELRRALLTNDGAKIAAQIAATGNTELAAGWKVTRGILNGIGEELAGLRRIKNLKDDYFPRLVTDREGLLKTLGKEAKTALEADLIAAEHAAIKQGAPGLTAAEESQIINKHIQVTKAQSFQPGFAKGRSIKEITAALQPFYATPAESLHAYLRGSIRDIEAAKLFGKDLSNLKVSGQTYINYPKSIGGVVGRELAAGKIDHTQANDLIGMLRDRFGGGDRQPSPVIQDIRNMVSGVLLGNVVAATGQLSDIGSAVWMHGMSPTVKAVVQHLRGKDQVKPIDLGITSHIDAEFVGSRWSAKFANWMHTHGVFGKHFTFESADIFGKALGANAALIKMQELVKTPKGQARLAEYYAKTFGEEFKPLVQDLLSEKITEPIRDLLFHEVSRNQPISQLEQSQFYHANPNGRILLMLKSWMLKQADMVRRETWNEIKTGDVTKGVKNLTTFGFALGVSGATFGMVQNWMLGRGLDVSASDVMENMLKTFALNSYTRDEVTKGHPIKALIDSGMPPYKVFEDVLKGDPKMIRYLPAIGPLLYAHIFGGKEAWAGRKEMQDKAEARAAKVSPEKKQADALKRIQNRDRRNAQSYQRVVP